MARTPADPSARLAILRAARKEVRAGEVLIGEDMARAVGLSWRKLRDLIDENPDWPVKVRGSEGVAWQFDARPLIDAMIGFYQAKVDVRAQKAARAAKLAGIAIAPEIATRYSLTELREIDRIQRDAHKRKIEQRDYVPIAEHRDVVSAIFSTIQSGILSSPAELDPAGKLPPEVRAMWIDHNRTLLVRLHEQVKDRLNDDARSARRARGRAGGAGKRPALR